MAYSRRTVLKLVLGGAALSQAACINLSPFGTRQPATSRSERLDYGQLKIYYNDDVVVYLTREFHLVFKDVEYHFKFRKLPLAMLNKAFATIGNVSVGTVSDKGRLAYGNAQSITLTFRADDLTAAEKQIMASMKVREDEAGGSAYTNPLINHGIVKAKQARYLTFIKLSSDFNNVYLNVTSPAGFFDGALKPNLIAPMRWDIPLDAARAKQQQETLSRAKSPIKIGADGRVFYKGKLLRNLADDVTFVDIRTRDHI